MKKVFVLFASLLTASLAIAGPVNKTDALKIATRFFTQDNTAAVAELTLVREGHVSAAVAPASLDQEPTYYVFNKADKGFVIIAGDNSVNPLIAYSYDESFPTGELPESMKWWLDTIVSGEIVASRVQACPALFTADVVPTAGTPVLEITTAKWDQGSPFNGESPTIDGHKTITGCVATAAAIKARYHKWPYKGSGTTPAYTYSSNDAGHNVTIPKNELGRIYDYDNMPLVYSGANATQRSAVAALMYDMGTVSQMMFGWTASGTYTNRLADGLKRYMHYSSRLTLTYKNSTDETTWAKKLEDEMQANGPIIYGGVDSKNGGGHQFIFDGYTDDHYFRVNWGWSGNGNGYFRVSNLGNSNTGVYDAQQDAIFNCAPDRTGIYTPAEVAKMTTLTYDAKTKVVNLKHTMAVNYSVADAEKKPLASGSLAAGANTNLSLASVPAGVYTVTIALQQYPEAIYTFEVEL